MSKNEIRRVYPIRKSRAKWFIRLFAFHDCNIHKNYIIDPIVEDCEKNNLIEDTFISLHNFDIENPQGYNGNLLNYDQIVVPDQKINIIFDYPLLNSTSISVSTKNINGFTLKELIHKVKKLYQYIYDEEMKTASEKTFQLEKLCVDCIFGKKSLNDYVIKHKCTKEDECPICYTNFDVNEDIGMLRCGHKYHNKCIVEWINFDGKNCPLCRTNIKECKECNGKLVINYSFTGKVIPLNERGIILNRNLSDGKYGIYGHDFEDLFLHGFWYDNKNKNLRLFIGV
jgi:hypothetical protein